ncbi:MAG: bifunctional riboflavin kinase/FAD synthetase [Ignavibacteria bacterium]|jgi:riboflavin kinase/FMN adenylyltransferase
MNIYSDISEIEKDTNSVVTVGTFDGLHIGHLDILNEVVDKAKKMNCRSVVVTFEPHPRTVVSKDDDVKLLTSLDERIEQYKKIGIENLMIINFTDEFRQLTSEEFVIDYIVNGIGVKNFVIGYDHKFGKDRGGDEHTMKEFGKKYGFDVTLVSAKTINGEISSSSKIRELLNRGDVTSASVYLGRNYSISGKVIKGEGRGRKLGFPTANVKISDDQKLIPAIGVYVVSVEIEGGLYYGIMNIGKRPTFDNHDKTIMEVNIFDFGKEIYNNEIKVNLLKRIRDEKKFNSKEELIEQIKSDKKEAQVFLSTLLVN